MPDLSNLKEQEEVAEKVDTILIQQIAAQDNGVDVMTSQVPIMTLCDIIYTFIPTGAGEDEIEKGFICKNYSECKFGIWKNDKFLEYYKKKPNKTMVNSILKKGEAIVKSLTDKNGNKFDAILTYQKNQNGYFSWFIKR